MKYPKNYMKGRQGLVVDDEEDNRFMLVNTLEYLGCKVMEAENGAIALVRFNENPGPLDFVITDVRMPEADGMHLLTEIRKTHPHIPVIVMVTGHSDYTDAQMIQAGAHSVFRKPFDLDKLAEKMILDIEKNDAA